MTTTGETEGRGEGVVRRRTLLLLRHGKSDWGAEYGADDRLRPLSSRGRAAARTMGRFLVAAHQLPDLAMTSPAVRAETTLELAMEAGGWRCPVLVRPPLYGEVTDLLDEVRHVPGDVWSVLVVSHSPACADAVRCLTGADVRFPTAAMVRVDLEIPTWGHANSRSGRIEWLVGPRLFRTI